MTTEVPENLLDDAPCGFVSFVDDGKISYVNRTLALRLGYSVTELKERHVESLLTVGSRIFYQTHFFPLIKLHGRVHELFLILRARNGEDIGVLCNAVRRDRNGDIRTDCVLMEVVERRKFEEALLEARHAAERANVELAARKKEAEDAASMLEQQAVELELQQQQLQEQAAELEAQSEELMTTNDELLQLNHDLEEQRAAAQEANQAKSNFLAVMSHELRTPLNAIGGYVQLLEMGVHGAINEAQQGTLARIDRSQRHLLRLINDILNLSRIEAGRVDYSIEAVSLREVVAGVLPMIEPQSAAKNLGIEQAIPSRLKAYADREKTQQIVLNLLTNAVKFTPSGGTICVEAHDNGEMVSIRVIDNGLGIPRAMLEKVFEPFIQVDASKSRATEGTGLGLAISRDLARGMGGDLTAESQVGHGSTFELTLPKAQQGRADRSEPEKTG